MSTGWWLLSAIAVVVAGLFLIGMYRGAAGHARSQTRQDLVKLGGIPMIAKSLTEVSSLPAYAFMAPFAGGRSLPFGWLWWRVEKDADGHPPLQRMGWALTYRGARKAAGLPLSIRAHHTEITLAEGQNLPADR